MSEDLLKRLHEQRLTAVHEARAIAERLSNTEVTEGESRAADQAAYDKANEEVSRLGALAQDERRRLDQESADAEAFNAAEKRANVKESRTKKGSDWQAEARAALRAGEQTKGGSVEQLPSEQRHREMRALTDPLQTIAATHGPEVIPVTLVERLFQKLFDDSAILSSGVTILRTGSGETLKFPRLASLGALPLSDARVPELGQIKKGNVTFDQVSLGAYKYGQISQADREVIEDGVIDVKGLMGTALGRNMANYLGYDLTLGDGDDKPLGVVNCVPNGNKVTGATGVAGAMSDMDDLLNVIAKLPPTYRRNAKWLMNDLTTFGIRKFKMNTTTGENAYAWQPSQSAGGPDTLLGYPVFLDPNIAGTGLGNVSAVFFDPSMYTVRLVNDVRVEWSTEFAWDYDLVSVKAVLRADGDTIDDTAFAAFVGGAT